MLIQDKVITVKLKSAKFSDGTALTADAVIYSFDRARQSEKFKQSLEDFEGVEKKGSSVVRFLLQTKNSKGENANVGIKGNRD